MDLCADLYDYICLKKTKGNFYICIHIENDLLVSLGVNLINSNLYMDLWY